MGGNLYHAGRIPKEQYFNIIETLKPVLDNHFGDQYKIPVAYKNKPTYGDVDIILNASKLQDRKWLPPLLKDLGVEQVKTVRNVTSLLYMNFQVDFFCVGESKFESTYNFMCYNVLGNLIGRIFHKFNLKYGEDGLKYVLRGFNNHVSKEILLTRDMKKILEFIGLDYDRWKEGFNNLTDIFEYVICCDYFCADSYNEDFFNVKKRATQRPDFNTFIDYLKEKNITRNYPFDKDKTLYITYIDSCFPEANLEEKYGEHVKIQEELFEMSKKFNGKIVMDLLKIEGVELGKFIGEFKEFYGDKFNNLILTSSKEEINNMVLIFYKNIING